MFEIDKEKFGAFVAALRREKGLLQKDLAEKLYVSDKAVSKWERGLSVPDIALLAPLAQILGVTVTELLECRRLPQDAPLDLEKTEESVQKMLNLSREEKQRARPDRRKRGLQLLLCALLGCLEVAGMVLLGCSWEELAACLVTCMVLMGVFGLYFCVFAPERLPKYYDENRISSFSDGILRMNVPGVYFHNRNWPHIVRAAQLWAMIGLAGLPAFWFFMSRLFPRVWNVASVYITLALVLGGLFVPMLLAARKYDAPTAAPEGRTGNRKLVLWLCVFLAAMGIFVLVLIGGFASTNSGMRMGWVETSGSNHWRASYAYHEGSCKRVINRSGEADMLTVSVVSDSGEMGILITDEEGAVLLEETGVPTSLLEIPIEGKVTVTITGSAHKGSFSITWRAPLKTPLLEFGRIFCLINAL